MQRDVTTRRRAAWTVAAHAAMIGCGWILWAAGSAQAKDPPQPPAFLVGAADCDLTPQAAMPMWGYGARHDLLSNGVLDNLTAKALVIAAGDQKLAVVGTDLGRGPTVPMMAKIRAALAEKAGIHHVIISGSHSHHGPVIELTDRDGHGKGKFDASVAYAAALPDKLIDVVLAADKAAKPARIGVANKQHALNRNRHSKRLPKPTDPLLNVVRFDDVDGKLIAVLVNFAAHPTMIDEMILKYSADYPGHMKRKVEKELGALCVFMQGASGDMSANPPPGVEGPQQFGEHLADHVLELARGCQTQAPAKPSLKGKTDRYLMGFRIDMTNPLIQAAFARAFFPELVRNFTAEMKDGIPVELNTVLLNEEIAMVSGSGEFFCNHAVRLRERAYVPHTLFFGYANGHNLYFPTIEAASEGGYGGDPQVSPVELGAGESLMNQALINLYAMLKKFSPEPAKKAAGRVVETAAK